MDINEIKKLSIELMDEVCSRNIGEFSVETEDISISIKKPTATSNSQPIVTTTVATQENTIEVKQEEQIKGTKVEAPLVGIFYASPSPEEQSFIEVGQTVKKGETLCIIEAMKTMNEIVAPCDGVISRIFAQNGDMIEYKQVICIIE